MKELATLLAFALLLQARADFAEPPLPKGRRLRTIVADKYPNGNVYVGGTTGWRKRPRGSGVIVDREFSYVTPENDFKQTQIHPKPGVWNWEYGDTWIKKCPERKQVLRLHAPVSPQCSRWAKDDSRTAKELKQNLIEYATELCKRYDKYKHVKWMDVVNETVSPNGQWNGPRKGADQWECPWTRIGFDKTHALKPPLYIKLAFEIATRHAPNTKLIINQNAGMQGAMWAKVKALVRYLRAKGLRVDGIGWQGYVDVGWEKQKGNMERLRALIDWAHKNKLSFHITEMNVWLKGRKDFNAQAKTFTAVMRALLERRDSGVVTWNVWNISDRYAWLREKHWEPCLFDRQYKAKPAYYALQKLLENPPDTKQKQLRRERLRTKQSRRRPKSRASLQSFLAWPWICSQPRPRTAVFCLLGY